MDNSILRDIICEKNVISQPDGSSLFNQGETSVMVAIYGPIEAKISKELYDKSYIEVIYKPKIGQTKCTHKYIEKMIKNICSTVIITNYFPSTSFTIILQEIDDNGSLLACCVNATALALLDAAVPLRFQFAAVHIVINSNNEIIVDPVKNMESESIGSITYILSNIDFKILGLLSNGQIKTELYDTCYNKAKELSSSIFQSYRNKYK